MGDAGEGLVDTESRLAERMNEREEEKTRASQAARGGDPERTRQLESCRLARALRLSGYVFKAGSPSCGIRGVPVHAGDMERVGRGLFAQTLIAALPDLPVADEEGLAHTAGRDDFLRRIHAYHIRAT